MARAQRVRNTGEAVHVEGLDDFLRALRKLDDRSFLKMVAEVSQDAAGGIVSDAKGRVSGAMAKRAAGSLKPAKSQKGALIRGGSGVPFFFGAEFGAGHNKPRQRSSGTYDGFNQFEPWRGSGGGAGYFLFPAIREGRKQMIEDYLDAIDEIAKEAFPD